MPNGVGINFPISAEKKGAFRSLLEFISYDCSTASAGKCANVFNDNTANNINNYWKSKSDINAYFEVTLNKGYLYPTGSGIFSCNDIDCIYNFTIYGVEKGEQNYKTLCTHLGEKNDFKSTYKTFDCFSQKPFYKFKVQQNWKSSSNSNQMNLYLFDFYGFLSFGICSIYTHKRIEICYLILILIG